MGEGSTFNGTLLHNGEASGALTRGIQTSISVVYYPKKRERTAKWFARGTYLLLVVLEPATSALQAAARAREVAGSLQTVE